MKRAPTHPHFHQHGVEGRHVHHHRHEGNLVSRLTAMLGFGPDHRGEDYHPHSHLTVTSEAQLRGRRA